MKRFTLCILALLILLAGVFSVSATTDLKENVYDNEGLLSVSEFFELSEKLDTISKTYRCDVVIVTTDDLEGKTATEYADDFYDYNGFGYGDSRDGILLLVSLAERQWATSTCGEAINIFTDSDLYEIENEVVPYLSDYDFYTAFDTFADQCEIRLSIELGYGGEDVLSNGEAPITYLHDHENLLTEDEAAELSEKLDAINDTYSCDVVIVTTDDLEGKTATEYADDYYDYNGFGDGNTRDGILLLVSLAERKWATSTCGEAIDIFNDSELYDIEDKFVPYLSDGEYYTAFDTFADLCEFRLSSIYGYHGETHAHHRTIQFSILYLFVGTIVGVVIAFIAVLIMKGQLKSVRYQPAAQNYLRNGSLNITERRDIFLYSTVSKRAKPKDTGSSGSSTHSSSSGSSHGGHSGSF